jgi:hypothetical protein
MELSFRIRRSLRKIWKPQKEMPVDEYATKEISSKSRGGEK